MAGGPSTPQLSAAVSDAGGLGFLGAGYKTARTVADDIHAVRSIGAAPFGVNLFVPGAPSDQHEAIGAYREALAPEALRQDAEVGEARHDDDDWEAKLTVLRELTPAVASFTFGCPDAETIAGLRASGVAVWVTVTTPEEARQAAEAGADALVVQGSEAGGHRGSFRDPDDAGIGLIALLRLVAAATPLPLIATGGIADGAAVAGALCAGACAAQLGTAFMLAPEAGTNPAQRALLSEPLATATTRAFTGRLARGIVNRFMREHEADAPSAYPEIHHVTAPLRAAARAGGDADAFNLWAGQAHELDSARPAGEIVRDLGAEARRTAAEVAARLGPG
jgi:nitronate monooxygenase